MHAQTPADQCFKPGCGFHLQCANATTSSVCIIRRAGSAGPSDDAQPEPKKRGRKPKTTASEPTDSDAAIPAAADPPAPKKRGRKTKAEIEQATQAADEAFTALGHDSGDEEQLEAADAEGLAIAPAEGPGSWAEAAATTAGEDDRRRFPYHRCAYGCSRNSSAQAQSAGSLCAVLRCGQLCDRP